MPFSTTTERGGGGGGGGGGRERGKWQLASLNSGSPGGGLTITGTVTQCGRFNQYRRSNGQRSYRSDSSPGNGVAAEDDQSSVTITVQVANTIVAWFIQLQAQVNAPDQHRRSYPPAGRSAQRDT